MEARMSTVRILISAGRLLIGVAAPEVRAEDSKILTLPERQRVFFQLVLALKNQADEAYLNCDRKVADHLYEEAQKAQGQMDAASTKDIRELVTEELSYRRLLNSSGIDF